jgi:hypothetical protein
VTRLLKSVAGTTDHPASAQGSTPLDAGVSPDGKSLYVVLPGSGKVAAWSIHSDGSLSKIGEFAGLPRTVDGTRRRPTSPHWEALPGSTSAEPPSSPQCPPPPPGVAGTVLVVFVPQTVAWRRVASLIA